MRSRERDDERETVDAPLLDAVVEAEVLVKVLGDAHKVADRQAALLERAVAQLEQLLEGEADCGPGVGSARVGRDGIEEDAQYEWKPVRARRE